MYVKVGRTITVSPCNVKVGLTITVSPSNVNVYLNCYSCGIFSGQLVKVGSFKHVFLQVRHVHRNTSKGQ